MAQEEKKLKFGFGIDEEHCEAEMYDTVEDALEAAQASWDEMDGDPFDADCEYSGCIWVGVAEQFTAKDFAPSLDDIADQMTDRFYSEHNIDDDADVDYSPRQEAREEWAKFVEKYFSLPCTISCYWFGRYDLREHRWVERFKEFDRYVKEG